MSKSFVKFTDTNCSNVKYICNESQKTRVEKALIETGVISAIYSFYEEFLEVDVPLSLNNNTNLIIVPYLSHINSNISLNTDLKDDFYFDIIKFPNMYIVPDKLIVNEKLPELLNFQIKKLSTLFIANYFSGLINEKDFSNFWLVIGIENWMSFCFLQKCFGNLFAKNMFIEKMNSFKKYVKNEMELRPLYSNNFIHPVELQMCQVLYLKSLLVMLLLENYVERSYVQKAIKNIINERSKNESTISTELFLKTLKKNCGLSLKKFLNCWILKTGILSLKVFYSYIEENNSVDVELYQFPEIIKSITKHPYVMIDNIELYADNQDQININNSQMKEMLSKLNINPLDYKQLQKIGKMPPIIDYNKRSNRYFDFDITLNIYQTNGFEVLKETHIISMDNEKESVQRNFSLCTKLRKCPIKKREQEFIQELIGNTNITKIYTNEEIEKILTKHSVLWIRADPDFMNLRIVNEVSKEDILLEYIKLFKDPELNGQYESVKNIYIHTKNKTKDSMGSILKDGKDNKSKDNSENNNDEEENESENINKENQQDNDESETNKEQTKVIPKKDMFNCELYRNTQIILETFIRSSQDIYFELRLYALKKYVKLMQHYKQKDDYAFVLECYETYEENLLKEKSVLNREAYLLLKSTILILGDYEERKFSDFNIIGKINVSKIESKIIEKFIVMTLNNQYNSIIGLNDCYITRDILIGCSKLTLEDKVIYILKKILNLLRIEKLKRSYNDIIVIGCIEAYLNILIKSNFFIEKGENNISDLLKQINEDIEFFMNNWAERNELIILCNYFILVLYLFRAENINEYVSTVYCYLLDRPIIKEKDINIINDDLFLNAKNKNSNNSEHENVLNEEIFSNKLYALYFVLYNFHQIFLTLDKQNEKSYNSKIYITGLIENLLKSYYLHLKPHFYNLYLNLYSMYKDNPYINYDVKYGNFKTYDLISLTKLKTSKLSINKIDSDKDLLFIGFSNKLISFSSSKYVDTLWLQEFLNSELHENKRANNGNDSENSSTNDKNHSQNYLVKKYQLKYKDHSVLLNYKLDLENYSINDAMLIIVNKLLEHESSTDFSYTLNKENLGDIYEDYISTIKVPMDLMTVKNKVNDLKYNNINEFISDIRLIFTNCREYNDRKSELYYNGNKLEDYFNILIDPIKNRNSSYEEKLKVSLENENYINKKKSKNTIENQSYSSEVKDNSYSLANCFMRKKGDIDNVSDLDSKGHINNKFKLSRKISEEDQIESENKYEMEDVYDEEVNQTLDDNKDKFENDDEY